MNQTNTTTIEFNGSKILTIKQNDKIYFGIKAICENIKIEYSSQLQKIKRDSVLREGMVIITIPVNGINQDVAFLPLDYLNGFLFTISIERLKNEEAKEILIKYKKECYQVLASHFLGIKSIQSPPLNPHIKSLTLKFYNKIIYIAKLPNTGEVLFNVSSLCDAIGVDVNCKRGKLNKDDIIKNNIYRLKAKLNQTAIFIPIKYLNYFLDTIYISPNHKNYKKITNNINLYLNECYNFIINQLPTIEEEEKRRKLLMIEENDENNIVNSISNRSIINTNIKNTNNIKTPQIPSSPSTQENLQYREIQETTQQIKHTQQQTKEVNQNKNNQQKEEQQKEQEIEYNNKLQAINLLRQYTLNSKAIQTILLRYPNYSYIINNITYLIDNFKTLHPNIKEINLRLIRVALRDNYAKIEINDNNNSTHINTNLLLKNEPTNQKQEQEEKTQDTDINKYITNYLTSKNYYNNLNNFNSNQEEEKTTEQKREFIIQALSFFISIDEIEELFDCCSYNYNYLYNNIHTVMNMYKHRIIK